MTMLSGQTMSAPYTKAVVAAMRKLYPEALADNSFDNTGLLLESPYDPTRRQNNSVLLTIDLTKAVADEAIRRQDSIIVAYHPIIFRGLKSLTLGDAQQSTLLRLAQHGISVYSPHTAVDASPGGLGDWLADIITGDSAQLSTPSARGSSHTASATSGGIVSEQHHLLHRPVHERGIETVQQILSEHERYPIRKSDTHAVHGAGMGRIVRFRTAVPLTSIVDRISVGLGDLKSFPLAVPQGQRISEILIKSVGICAGSGSHLFSEMDERVDLLFTGELSHHDALAAIERGQCVICPFHSNTERGYLRSRLKPQLEKAIREELENVHRQPEQATDVVEAVKDHTSEVHVSHSDRDPYEISTATRTSD